MLFRSSPVSHYQKDPFLKEAVDLIREGFFSPDEPDLFQPLIDGLLHSDAYLVLADFAAYHEAQMRIDALYRNPEAWTEKTIRNVARIGGFSSDRTIREYNRDIWHCTPLRIPQEEADRKE